MTVLIALAGGLGAASRFVLDGFITERTAAGYPWATTIINVSGAFLLGLIVGLGSDSDWLTVAGVGFLGGYTTFSTASFETARLAHDGRYGAALANGLGMLVVAVGAASIGFWLGALA